MPDWNPAIGLLDQARRLVTDRQDRGVDLWELFTEQSGYARDVPQGTIAYLFHSMVLLQVVRRLGDMPGTDDDIAAAEGRNGEQS